jgi:hypothetical protein
MIKVTKKKEIIKDVESDSITYLPNWLNFKSEKEQNKR